MSYKANAGTPAPGSVGLAQLGPDITDLAKTLLAQETPEEAKTTLEVTEGGGGSTVAPYTY